MHEMISAMTVTPPRICGLAEVLLAHQQMQRHRGCRIDRCGWKWVAYCTLVHHGRIAPQRTGPRERAHARGIDFPVGGVGPARIADAPELPTLQQVLDGLAALAMPPTGWNTRFER
ncbi:hypothetical protein [Nocardia wallacei]|uniref:Uncharacterized protein n=1 Tax=Nocardia wallacei TaxID=480035 RepID=A0A7G1KKB4_9NOCA|nr:hypothetical protein [Nocardia wallacei]BCK54996.1 hypothetical protein NWFMUON74_27680 [Nocardia wallacei]